MVIENRKKYSLIIGIDTGVHTGLASWNVIARKFELITTTSIHKAMRYVNDMHNTYGGKVLVRIEDPRLRRWFGTERMSREEERKKLQGVGSVKRDAKIWEDFLQDMGIPFEMTHPKNSVTKLNDLSFRKLTKYSKQTSEHSRDAAMLVFGY